MGKSTDIRPKITLACQECKHRNYITKKNRRNDPDRMDLKKFCPTCRQHTDHRDLVSALVKMYEDNASTLTPDPLHSAFYDSHPPASVRVKRLTMAAA